DSLPRWDVPLEPNESLSVQTADINSLLARKHMLRTAHKNQRVASQRNDFDLRPLSRISHNTHVDHMVYYILVHLIWPAVFDMNVYLRIRLDEALQHRGQLVNADRVDCCHSNLPAHNVAQPFHLFSERIEAIDDFATPLVESHPGFGRHHRAASTSLDQPSVELIL